MKSSELRKKVGQLLVVGFKGTTASEEIKELIREHHVGGIILFGRNIGTPQEILNLTNELQREARAAGHEQPLLICIDQENGVVRRLGEGATIFPGAMLLGATGNPENAYRVGLATGKELKALGINWNLAPVLDVNNNPENPVIGVRSYGESADKVSLFGQHAMKGMQDAGVITTLKHFPGHGDTNVDSHLDLPVISHSIDRLQEVELKPFTENIKQGADTIMSAHVYFPAIEDTPGVPATLSKKVITGLLREQLGFDGVVTTDCMEMNAIANTIGTAAGGVAAIKAGVDLIMVSHLHNLQKDTIEAIVRAVEAGEIDKETIDAAAGRIERLKDTYIHWDDLNLVGNALVPSIVGCQEHEQLADVIYKQGITVVKNKEILPLNTIGKQKVLVVYSENTYTMQVEDKRYSSMHLGEAVKELDPLAHVLELSNPATAEEIDRAAEVAKDFDFIIIGTLTAKPGDAQVKLVEKLHDTGVPIVVVATRSPYDLAYLPDIHAYICTYEFPYPALKIAAQAIYGQAVVTGKLPVTIPQ
ncbi:beta-N-acetylhexosaminidase [Bacillus sp. FJAT-27225]|uniref:beta-N-acetylhexosaminidase n=1 Tax=Bacillus sp. FJAT-27225 TaxID=1743144 RepID=UPI00080C213D|nr:beta-N-acetylhexosaminidase [Bacillus sp. FJAT-27225]OCA85881.1 beta-N-acetylhexosaminidase [Bacillus sp. FJAT-27225]